MPDLVIEGGIPLMGNVKISGAKNSAIKLLYASLLSNENIVLENVPQIEFVETDIEIIKSLGAKVEWVGNDRLLVNASGLSTFEIPSEFGAVYRSSYLAVPALLFRFGKAVVPKLDFSLNPKLTPINKFFETWEHFGIAVEEEFDKYILRTGSINPADFNFKTISHMGTDNAILTASFIDGESIINNVSEESEIDDLINLVTTMGAKVSRPAPHKIIVRGTNIFKGGTAYVQADKAEVATFAIATVLTKGDVVLEDIDKTALVSFTSFLSKIGARFEYSKNDFKIWRAGDKLEPQSLNISPSPGFVSDWQPLAVLALTQADGLSTVHDTVYTNRFGYVKDLNRMGTRIDLMKPSEAGVQSIVNDDSYDVDVMGEPQNFVKIYGPTKLKGNKVDIPDFKYGGVLALAALIAEGRSTVSSWYNIEKGFHNFFEKLDNLGARISTE